MSSLVFTSINVHIPPLFDGEWAALKLIDVRDEAGGPGILRFAAPGSRPLF
jgi:hypothetical protein